MKQVKLQYNINEKGFYPEIDNKKITKDLPFKYLELAIATCIGRRICYYLKVSDISKGNLFLKVFIGDNKIKIITTNKDSRFQKILKQSVSSCWMINHLTLNYEIITK